MVKKKAKFGKVILPTGEISSELRPRRFGGYGAGCHGCLETF
jgi:hypothetical protein